ncbi:MAG: crossover junction endodeoxyribonuclease RuvC [Desulfovibrionales bacterium]|nr:crossover junction endodeoxyribonuclease RuvC [Desulfovibrionales bacterium]
MAPGGLVVLGLDPGSNVTGYGVVAEVSGQVRLLETGCVRTKSSEDFCSRLGVIFHGVRAVIDKFHPAEAALEDVFVSRNTASALKLGQARGAAVAACAASELPVSGYTPAQVKKSLVGAGRADKEQVAFMVAQVLGVKRINAPLDATDALAVALCHLSMRKYAKLAGLS